MEYSSLSSFIEDILSHGDIVGEGIPLQGEPLRLVANHSAKHFPATDYQEPAKEFEVVRKLGTGSCAIVYLVREVLYCSPPSKDESIYPGGRLGLHDFSSAPRSPLSVTEYGREYAIKLLFKADFDKEDLAAQFTEDNNNFSDDIQALNHLSIPAHPNIVTLYRTLETSVSLVLLLEFVPGQDLRYFLEQARDHYDVVPASDPALNCTPATPSLLSSLDPSELLSYSRLHLIASMFAQMCEAVATCHDVSVFHRDIKPENFTVTDGWTLNKDGVREHKVVVKLSDFGLSTCDAVSDDIDCGSVPYMSFECRNNVAPVYRPRAADVWSLGIVLINLLYHYNPWMDTVKGEGECSSFLLYLSNPTNFFMQNFTGMTSPIANFLVENVFCILDDPTDDSRRIGAREFGVWIRDLPTLMGTLQLTTPIHMRSRVPSRSFIFGHSLAYAPDSRRPSSRSTLVARAPRRLPAALHAIPQNILQVGDAWDFVLVEEDEDEEQQQQHSEQKAGDGHFPSIKSRKGSLLSTDSSLQSYYTAHTSLSSYLTMNTASTQSSNLSFPYSVTSVNSYKSRKNVLYPRRVHPLPVTVPVSTDAQTQTEPPEGLLSRPAPPVLSLSESISTIIMGLEAKGEGRFTNGYTQSHSGGGERSVPRRILRRLIPSSMGRKV